MRTSRLFILALAMTPAWHVSHAQTQPAGQRPAIIAVAVRGTLRGIQLTDAQRTAVKTIVTQHAPQMAAVRETMKPWAAKLKTAREQKDTAAARTARVALRGGRLDLAKVTRGTLVDVRATLTAPQQAQFDTNSRRVKAMLTRFVRTGARPG
jgi:hypothetical protein